MMVWHINIHKLSHVAPRLRHIDIGLNKATWHLNIGVMFICMASYMMASYEHVNHVFKVMACLGFQFC
jgi:hypothetical protein